MINTSAKIISVEEAKKLRDSWKKEGAKIVFTNGCFDIIHLGHVDYLEKARNLGTHLIVGVNTDASVQRLKGPTRPVVDQYARARVLASLQFIDTVIFFDEDTPYELIRQIEPDILVKGDDYTPDKIIGADIVLKRGGEVKTISLVKGYSTTQIVSKIKST